MYAFVYNADFSFHQKINIRKAISLIRRGKAEVLEYSDKILYNCEKTVKIIVPYKLRLTEMVTIIFKRKVHFSKRNIHLRDNFTCGYCGKYEENPTIDHIIPISKGGKDTWENCITCCYQCNNKKGDKTDIEFGIEIKNKPKELTVSEFIRLNAKYYGIEYQYSYK